MTAERFSCACSRYDKVHHIQTIGDFVVGGRVGVAFTSEFLGGCGLQI